MKGVWLRNVMFLLVKSVHRTNHSLSVVQPLSFSTRVSVFGGYGGRRARLKPHSKRPAYEERGRARVFRPHEETSARPPE